MKKPLLTFLIICGLYSSRYSDPLYYVSPGVHFEYNFNGTLSWGLKISGGACTENNIGNLTIGITEGTIYERFVEIQYMPRSALIGAGLGISHIQNENHSNSAWRPRCSLFAGYGLYGNFIFIPMLPEGLPQVRIGSTLVLPIPLNPPSFNLNLFPPGS